MMLIDAHAHLYWDSFKADYNDVIQRAIDADVTTIINVGVDVKTSQRAIELQSGNPQVKFYSTIGIHPHEALRLVQDFDGELSRTGQHAKDDVSIHEDIERLEKIYLSDTTKIVSIGECGLDYLYGTNNLYPNVFLPPSQIKDLQRKLFQAQIDLAKKLNLPLIVHCREAWDEVIDMTKDCFGIYHCYSGLPSTTNHILKTDFLISFAGNLTYPKNEYLKEAVKIIPLEKIVIETDCPFLPPQSKRGQRNEPSCIKETAQMIADLKNLSLEEIAQAITANVKRVLKLP